MDVEMDVEMDEMDEMDDEQKIVSVFRTTVVVMGIGAVNN